jgi:hypothetical protein
MSIIQNVMRDPHKLLTPAPAARSFPGGMADIPFKAIFRPI